MGEYENRQGDCGSFGTEGPEKSPEIVPRAFRCSYAATGLT